jgi:lipopolysaccharide/colanic/teichoic acid biosynthesis glycosyltransferase
MTAEPMALSTAIAIGADSRALGWPLVEAERTAAPDTRRSAAAFTYAMAKRVLDVVTAASLMLVLLPVFAVLGAAIVLDSGWPVFYRGTRVGRHGSEFTVLKFRSMRRGCDQTPHVALVRGLMRGANPCAFYKVADDRRITRVGGFLRRSSLDELPQLWNVLRGEMTLVGPRPDVPYAVAEYADWIRSRLEVKPGITGLWQVSGRSRLSLLEMYRLDQRYVANASLLLDLRILWRTLPVVLGRDGAA